MIFPPRPILFLAFVVAFAGTASAQNPEPLALQGVIPGGLRSSATGSWGTYQVIVTNNGTTPREARVLIFYPEKPDEQFGRDVWVPARATITTWIPVGPAPEKPGNAIDVLALLYDRTDGKERLVLPPGDERARSRLASYRKREPTTAIVLDPPEGFVESPDDTEAVLLAHAFRYSVGLSERVSIVYDVALPPHVEAFDGVDHVILAGRRLVSDPVARAALRAWVHRGGKLWVRLDRVDYDLVASIFGDELGVQVVDRVGLTSVRLQRPREQTPANPVQYEQPIDFLRVALSPGESIGHVTDGWPASFSRRVGRGKVVFTTLGARAWTRPRTAKDVKSPFENVPDLPVGSMSLTELANELDLKEEPPTLTDADLTPLVNEVVGYSVLDRTTVAGVLGTFVAVVLGAGVFVRRAVRGFAGYIAPAAAGVTAVGLVGLGEASRRAVAPTVAVAEIVDVSPVSGEISARGLFAVYRPDSGPVPLATHSTALLSLDSEGLDGQVRRRVQTDAAEWQWHGLTLPAGVRTGTFRSSARPGPITAIARFGSAGLEGTLKSPTFSEPKDGLLLTAGHSFLPVQFSDDGRFTAAGESLPAGQFVSGTVLTDRQQRRQEIYRKLLGDKLPKYLADRDVLLAWTRPEELPFAVEDTTRRTGASLLIVPLDLRAAPPGTPITIPAAFLPFHRVVNGQQRIPTLDSDYPVDMALRFQLPESARSMTVERAVLVARVRSPSRRFAVSGTVNKMKVVLTDVNGPTEPIRVEVKDPRLLKQDAQGGLTFNVEFGSWSGPHNPWKIESIGLEVTGRMPER